MALTAVDCDAPRWLLLTTEQVALVLDCSKETVNRHVRRYGVPRCRADGRECESGRYVYLSDFLNRKSRRYATNHQRRNDLRRAGLLPS